MADLIRALFIVALLLGLANATLAGSKSGNVQCTSTYSKTLDRYDTLCRDGTRGYHYWNLTLRRWETAVQPPGTRQTCSAQVHPRKQQVELRGR